MPKLTLPNDEILYYRQIGTTGPSVVLLHGFGADSRSWIPFAWLLRSKCRFFIPDFPGSGRSYLHKAPRDGRVLEAYAQTVSLLIEQLELRDVILVGFSMGALVALQLHAQGQFQRIARYVHIDHTPFAGSAPGWEGGLDPSLRKILHDVCDLVEAKPGLKHASFAELPNEIRFAYRDALEALGGLSLTAPLPRFLNSVAHQTSFLNKWAIERVAWPWAYAILYSYAHGVYDFRPFISSLPVPVHLVQGQQSRLFGQGAMQWMRQELPSAQVHLFSESGHDLMFHAPLKFVQTMRQILEHS